MCKSRRQAHERCRARSGKAPTSRSTSTYATGPYTLVVRNHEFREARRSMRERVLERRPTATGASTLQRESGLLAKLPATRPYTPSTLLHCTWGCAVLLPTSLNTISRRELSSPLFTCIWGRERLLQPLRLWSISLHWPHRWTRVGRSSPSLEFWSCRRLPWGKLLFTGTSCAGGAGNSAGCGTAAAPTALANVATW